MERCMKDMHEFSLLTLAFSQMTLDLLHEASARASLPSPRQGLTRI